MFPAALNIRTMDQFGVEHLGSKAMKLNRAQVIVAYNFVDAELLWEALQAAGSGVFACDNGRRLTTEGNKPLAAVGDSVLSLYYKVRGRDKYHSIGRTAHVCTKNVLLILTPS